MFYHYGPEEIPLRILFSIFPLYREYFTANTQANDPEYVRMEFWTEIQILLAAKTVQLLHTKY